MTPACQTTVVTFAAPPTTHPGGGVTGRRDGGLSDARDGASSDRTADDRSLGTDTGNGPDASDASSVPTSPSFEEAYAGGLLGGEVGRYVQVTCCSSAAASDCVTRVLGSAISCVDPASWKQNGSMVCQSLGLALGDYGIYGKCSYVDAARLEQTKGAARFAQFTCCLAPSNCVNEVRGGTDLCVDPATWTSLVERSCKELGGEIQSLILNGPC